MRRIRLRTTLVCLYLLGGFLLGRIAALSGTYPVVTICGAIVLLWGCMLFLVLDATRDTNSTKREERKEATNDD